MPCGKEAIAVFLEENLPRVGGSYRQFSERRALREESHRRFFGREFAEGRGQLSPIFGEACPGGRQPSPIFWQRICRGETTAIANFWSGVPWGKAATADFLAENLPSLPLAKAGSQGGAEYGRLPKTIQKGTKKGPKWYPGGTLEPPGSRSERGTCFSEKVLSFLGTLFEAWSDHLGHLFLRFFRVPSRNDFWTILEPKRPPKGRPLEVHLGTFFENPKSVISETPHQV